MAREKDAFLYYVIVKYCSFGDFNSSPNKLDTTETEHPNYCYCLDRTSVILKSGWNRLFLTERGIYFAR